MKPIYFITSNRHKFDEVKAIIPCVEMVKLELTEVQSLDSRVIIEHKLREAIAHGYSPCIVDDTSHECAGLNGLPGPFAKFFHERLPLPKLAEIIIGTGDNRVCSRTMIGYSDGAGTHFFEGVMEGTIVPPRGSQGFGWDPILLPDGSSKTTAEMSQTDKNALSMRGQAARKLKAFLELN